MCSGALFWVFRLFPSFNIIAKHNERVIPSNLLYESFIAGAFYAVFMERITFDVSEVRTGQVKELVSEKTINDVSICSWAQKIVVMKSFFFCLPV